MTEKSCGTIPYTIIDGSIHYLLIKSKISGNCSFPKGHVEAGESETETALRETYEETSVHVEITTDLRFELTYPMSNGNHKIVVFFPARFDGQSPKRNGNFEDYEYMLLPYEEAYAKISFANVRQALKETNDCLNQNIQKDWL